MRWLGMTVTYSGFAMAFWYRAGLYDHGSLHRHGNDP